MRRFQNKDGSYTKAGRSRYGKLNPDGSYKNVKKAQKKYDKVMAKALSGRRGIKLYNEAAKRWNKEMSDKFTEHLKQKYGEIVFNLSGVPYENIERMGPKIQRKYDRMIEEAEQSMLDMQMKVVEEKYGKRPE